MQHGNAGMANKAVISARVSEELARKLDALCESTGRSKAFHAEQAISAYVASQEWQIEAIQHAIDYADAGGERVDHAAVSDWLATWGTDKETPTLP